MNTPEKIDDIYNTYLAYALGMSPVWVPIHEVWHATAARLGQVHKASGKLLSRVELAQEVHHLNNGPDLAEMVADLNSAHERLVLAKLVLGSSVDNGDDFGTLTVVVERLHECLNGYLTKHGLGAVPCVACVEVIFTGESRGAHTCGAQGAGVVVDSSGIHDNESAEARETRRQDELLDALGR